MVFGLEQEDGNFNYSRGAGTSFPLEAGRAISTEICGLDGVGSGPYTPFIIYVSYIIAALWEIKLSSF